MVQRTGHPGDRLSRGTDRPGTDRPGDVSFQKSVGQTVPGTDRSGTDRQGTQNENSFLVIYMLIIVISDLLSFSTPCHIAKLNICINRVETKIFVFVFSLKFCKSFS
jgi:hypothetical protein